MKTTIKYIFRALLFLLGLTAFCVLVGEPTESLTFSEVIIFKALALGTFVGVVKVYLLTLTEEEREELEK